MCLWCYRAGDIPAGGYFIMLPTIDLTSNQYSEPYPMTAGTKGIVIIEFASAPGTTTTIQMASEPTFTKYDETTIPAQTTTRAEWQSTNPLGSIIRVKNTSDVNITAVYANQQTTF